MFNTRLILSFLIICVLIPAGAYSITIDEFTGDQQTSAGAFGDVGTSGITVPLNASGTRSTAIGGARKFIVSAIDGSAVIRTRLSASETFGFLSHSQDAGAKGISQITWDGSTDTSAFNATGLGGIDFTQDSSTAVEVDILSFDNPAGTSVDIDIEIYTNAASASVATLSLTSTITTSTVFSIPFTSFTKRSGASSSADFTSVGAIRLKINGVNPNVDLQLDNLGTDGCPFVPDASGKVIDDCGVCGGDNSTCTDCAGVPFGAATVDRCGECGGSGDSCLGCKSYDQGNILGQLDGGAKQHERLIKKITRELLKLDSSASTVRYVKKIRANAHDLQIANWILSWTFPTVVNQCSNQTFCLSKSNDTVKDGYTANSNSLKRIGRKAIRKIKALDPSNSRADRFLKKNRKMHSENTALLDQVPSAQSVCS